jgi:hypothetical protein
MTVAEAPRLFEQNPSFLSLLGYQEICPLDAARREPSRPRRYEARRAANASSVAFLAVALTLTVSTGTPCTTVLRTS